MTLTLDDLANEPCWVAWHNEERGGKPTKVPYAPAGGLAKADDPRTWGSRRAAEVRARRIANGAGGGIGVVLGIDLGGGLRLGGIDLDTCRDGGGAIDDWAAEVIARFDSYSEISPSSTGAKVFFAYRDGDRPAIEALLSPAATGKQFKRGNGADHPPGIEIYIDRRYFAVTGEALGRAELRTAEIAEIRWLIAFGESFAGASEAKSGDSSQGRSRDESRSGAAFRLGQRMRRAGADFEAFREAVSTDLETADWYREKGAVNDERELRRIWKKAEPVAKGDLPTIKLCAGERPRIVAEAIDALEEAGVPLYRRGLSIVHVARIPAKASDGADTTMPAIVTVPSQQLVHELGKTARWVKYDGRREGWVPADVPADVAAKIAALPNEWSFPPMTGIIGTQTMRPDGSLLTEPGYDPATGFLLFDPPKIPAIPERPTEEDALRALRALNRLLGEFPFAFDQEKHSQRNNPSRSAALSMLMTPVLRAALPPAVPLHAVNAPVGGTGKSYLGDLASALVTGERCPVIARSPNAEETEKRLVGAALRGQPIIAIDNVNGELRSEFLCQAVERPLLQVRALGTSDLARIENSTTCFANGNNIVIAEDLVRRTIQCRLDANMERPETRKFERNPLAEILGRRGRYVAAVLTIARAYIVAGMPGKPPPFASFDRWSELVRGALIWLGGADAIETVADLAVADPVKNERAELFAAITGVRPAKAEGYSVSEIIAAAKEGIAKGKDGLMDALMAVAGADGEINPKRLGKWLAASQNAMASGFKLLRNDRDSSRIRWQIVAVNASKG